MFEQRRCSNRAWKTVTLFEDDISRGNAHTRCDSICELPRLISVFDDLIALNSQLPFNDSQLTGLKSD